MRMFVLLGALFCALLAQPTQAAPGPIKASQVLAAANSYLGVKYVWGGFSPSGFDCSGFVSWIWQIPRRTTDTMADMVVPITKDELLPGDAMNNPLPGRHGHIRLFEKWATSDHRLVWVYEATGPGVIHRIVPYDTRYQPVRRIGIESDVPLPPAPASVPGRDAPRRVNNDQTPIRQSRGTTAVAGRVVDASNGQGIAGAKVFYWTETEQYDTKNVTADGEGRFKVTGLKPGFYEFASYANGHDVEFHDHVQVKKDNTTTANFRLRSDAGAGEFAAASLPPDHDVPNGHFFSQRGNGDGITGYAVTNDGGVRFWDEFQRLGGVNALGYPVSRRFEQGGFTVQAFQKGVLQWRPDAGQAWLTNVFDQMHDAGKDQWLGEARQTPAPGSFPDGDWNTVVGARQGALDANQAVKDRYFSVADPMTFFGLPTSQVTDEGNHFAVRLQRAVIQVWKVDVPWAKAGETTVANGGDIAREAGLFPAAAVAAQRSPLLGG